MLLEIIRPYVISFISIFIAIDIIGNIPFFLSLTEKFSQKQKKKVIHESILYGLILTTIFIFCGKYLLQIIGITISDFKIAGGILLIVLSINLMLSKEKESHQSKQYNIDLGILPLTTPLIAGPALFTISLIILDEFGIVITLTALVLNMLLSWWVLVKSHFISKVFGERGIRFLSKLFEILLASLAIMMIRQGILETFFK